MKIQTVLGPIDDKDLGRTLVHEHLLIAFPGVEFDPKTRFDREAFIAEAVRRLTQLRVEHGVRTFVDPCPIELGRDVRAMAEISARAEMNIVCTTGFYFDASGIPPYWRTSTVEQIAELYITEIQKGVFETGIRAGALKCATSGPAITPAEAKCLAAASMAQRETGVPIITHTQGGLGGPEQQDLFEEHGVPLHRALIGHCCESADRGYHRRIAGRGSYIGFDRIGWLQFQRDEVRADCLVDLFNAGYREHILMSQDRYCAMVGRYGRKQSAEEVARMEQAMRRGDWPPPFTHLFDTFIPMLVERGMDRKHIDELLDENPRRFFGAETEPRLVAAAGASPA